MRVLIAPDSFTGTLTAAQAAEAIAAGWARTSPRDQLTCRPMSDGGPGFLDAVSSGLAGKRHSVRVTGPLGDQVRAELLVTPGPPATAWLESAQAAGLALIPPGRRDPMRATSRGVGELVTAAISLGVQRVVVGVGGTGSTDGGAGLLAALGARATGAALDQGGAGLVGLVDIDLRPALARVAGVDLQVATDVDVPLLGRRGAALGFGPQKGASREQAHILEGALEHLAASIGADCAGRHPQVALGAGAGGGIGYSLLVLGARRVAGIATVSQAVGLAQAAADADLVITGEGSFDWQSAAGKVVAGVGAAARDGAVPLVVLAGRVELARSQWAELGVSAAYGVVEPGSPPSVEPWDALAVLAERVARTWARR